MLTERIGDDERRSSAPLPGASRRVAARRVRLLCWASSAYRCGYAVVSPPRIQARRAGNATCADFPTGS
jgi:hypothetical protein